MTLRNRTVPLPGRAGGLPLGAVRDKRIVTLVYTDMEGSTRLLGALRDAFLPVLERQRRRCGRVGSERAERGQPVKASAEQRGHRLIPEVVETGLVAGRDAGDVAVGPRQQLVHDGRHVARNRISLCGRSRRVRRLSGGHRSRRDPAVRQPPADRRALRPAPPPRASL